MKSINRTPKTPQKDKVVIDADEYTGDEKIEFICSEYNIGPLVTLADKTGNSNLFCRHCGASYDTEDATVRVKQRLSVPEEIEPDITSIQTNMANEVEIRHTVPIRGGFAELQKKGLKIKDYKTTERQ
jgi:hypothetical protein